VFADVLQEDLIFFLDVGSFGISLYFYNSIQLSKEEIRYQNVVQKLHNRGSAKYVYLDCQGSVESSWVVVLLSRLNEPEIVSVLIKKKLIEDGWRVCTYDRCGIGWSSHSRELSTFKGFVSEFTDLVKQSEISHRKIILVGTMLGANIISTFIRDWPITAAYLIDPILPIPDHYVHLHALYNRQRYFLYVAKHLSEYGFLRPLWYFNMAHPLGRWIQDLPEDETLLDQYYYLTAKSPGYYSGLLRELEFWNHPLPFGELESLTALNNKTTPIKVELRELAYSFSFSNPDLTTEWKKSREELNRLLTDKVLIEVLQEDHMGRLYTDEPLPDRINRFHHRLKLFISSVVNNQTINK